MKKNICRLIGSCMLLMTMKSTVKAQSDWSKIDLTGVVSNDTISKNGYTLIFINKDAGFDTLLGHRMIDAFFIVYPKEAALYNPAVTRKVIFIIDPAYDGVAATADGITRYNPKYFHRFPNDVDVVTHEVMHIVQDYPDNAGPGWITEGIADYVRYTMGIDNADAGWKLPNYSGKQSYEDAYRVTARFFVWIETTKKVDLVKPLDAAMRNKKYKASIWKKITGSSLDELWAEYSKSPSIDSSVAR
jgi:hypothetical protein